MFTSTGMAGAIASRRSLTTATSKGSAARIAIPTGGRVYAKSSAIFSGGGLSVGIGLYDQLDTDNGDNGVYIIKGWRIVGREFNRHAEQSSYDHADMLHDIDDSQPEHMRLGAYIDAVEVPRGELAEGDEVWVETVREGFKPFRVCGFARLPWERENGELHPFIEMCNVEEGREAVLLNPNNFIRTATVRVTR